MVVKDNNNNKDEKKESIGKKFGLWIARIIVMVLFLYLAAVLFNYFPLLPIYGATYLPLDNRLFKDFNTVDDQQPPAPPAPSAPPAPLAVVKQSGGGASSPWGGNITDLIKLYINVWNELKSNKDMKFNLEGNKADKTVGDLIQSENKKLGNKTQLNAEDTTISKIINNMLRNPATMKTIRDTMSKKSKHFFASIPITAALLKIAEFAGVAYINNDGNVIEGTNYGIPKTVKFHNPEKKELSIAKLFVEQEGGNFVHKTVYDVNKFCTKNMIFWYLKQFVVLVGSTIAAIFMWPIYYLHEVEIVQEAPMGETGKVEPCQGNSKGKALQIIILILGLLFMVYNAYARCYSFTESFVTIFKSGKLGKTWSDIILWVSIVGGIVVGVIGFFLFRNYEGVRETASAALKNGEKAGSKISSMLSQPLLRGLIDHYGLVKSMFISLIGAVLLGSIWSMSLTGGWPLLAIFAFFFPIAGLILIYLTQSEMLTLFSKSSLPSDQKAAQLDLNAENSNNSSNKQELSQIVKS